jgi:hypothetical protein
MPPRNNPYIAGSPIQGEEMFFGREDIFEFIKARLAGGPQDNSIVLHGQRRTGKTSILYQMHRRIDPRYLCVYVNLHAFNLNGIENLLRELAYYLTNGLQRDYNMRVPSIDEKQLATNTRSYFRDQFLDGIWSSIGNRHLLLMLDEVARIQEQVQDGKLGRDVFEYMRYLMQHHRQLNFLFSLVGGFEEPEKEYANLLGVGLYKPVSFLSRKAAESLVRQPVEDVYHIESEALDYILDLTSCHPYYTQLLCHCLFAYCLQNGLSSVGKQPVEAAVTEATELGQLNIRSIWQEATPGEKAVLSALAACIGDPLNRTSLGKAFDTWAQRGVLLPEEEISRAVRSLRYRQIITGGVSYGFAVDLHRRWLSEERALDLVEQEIGSWIALWAERASEDRATASSSRQERSDRHASEALKPLRFGGRPYTDRRSLARALATEWDTARQRYFVAMSTPSGPSEAWLTLREWLRQFDDPIRSDSEDRVELVDNYLTGKASPDVKLLHLLRWLDPTMPPVYLGHRLLPEDLVVVGLQAHQLEKGTRSPAFSRIVADLWSKQLLQLLSGFSGGGTLGEVDRRWREYVRRWSSRQVWEGIVPAYVSHDLADARVHGLLLSLAAAPAQQLNALRDWASRAVATVRGPVPWFKHLVQTAGDDPLQHVAIILASPHAIAHVDQMENNRRTWEQAETDRLGRRAEAIRWAALGSIPLLVFWSPFPWLALTNHGLSFVNKVAVTVLALVVLTTQVITELSVATRLVGDYHPKWSLLGWLVRTIIAAGKAAGAPISSMVDQVLPDDASDDLIDIITLVILVILFILSLLILVLVDKWLVTTWWVIGLAAVGPAHVVLARYRIRNWHSLHTETRQAMLGQINGRWNPTA